MFIESSAILGGSPSRQRIEQFHEARLVRIAHGGAAITRQPIRSKEESTHRHLSLSFSRGIRILISGVFVQV